MLMIWSVTIFNTSLGATRASVPVMASIRPATGRKLTSAARNSSAGNRARKK
jgi:hypothetical protein